MGHLRLLPHREARRGRNRRNVLKREKGGKAVKKPTRDKTRDDKMGNTEVVQAAHTE